MRAMSVKRRRETKQRQACVDLVLERDHWVCQAAQFLIDPCEGELTAHEVVQRSVRPGSHLEPALQICVCHRHHMYLHDDMTYAFHVGLLRRSWDVNEDGTLKPFECHCEWCEKS